MYAAEVKVHLYLFGETKGGDASGKRSNVFFVLIESAGVYNRSEEKETVCGSSERVQQESIVRLLV